MKFHRRGQRSTPQGEHRPIMLHEIIEFLDIQPGHTAVDCTLGFAGHSMEMLKKVGTEGRLIAFDLDQQNITKAEENLKQIGHPFTTKHGNFAGLANVMAEFELEGIDALLADLGMSSMQIDDPARGFSFARDGELDMRMDQSRGRTAAELIATLPAEQLAQAFRDLADEPEAEKIAEAIVRIRAERPILRTRELKELILKEAPAKINYHPRKGEPTPRQQEIRPVARVFQALRILVNRELASLQELLRVLPYCLKSGGKAAILSFHSGEDRLVKNAFKEGLRSGLYSKVSDDPVRPSSQERFENPRSRSAKLRWAIRS